MDKTFLIQVLKQYVLNFNNKYIFDYQTLGNIFEKDYLCARYF